MGGLVPKSYYLANQSNQQAQDDNPDEMNTLLLPAGSKEDLEFNVPSSGQKLRYKTY